MYTEIEGDLIELAKKGEFNVITHGCNCFCTMGSGIAPKIAKTFGADKFKLEGSGFKGDINKLGNIDLELRMISAIDGQVMTVAQGSARYQNGVGSIEDKVLFIVNSYTQYHYGANHKDGIKNPVDYDAITLCMRKINHEFKGKHIGLPKIGCGLAGGDWTVVKSIIQNELKDMDVTVVIYNK